MGPVEAAAPEEGGGVEGVGEGGEGELGGGSLLARGEDAGVLWRGGEGGDEVVDGSRAEGLRFSGVAIEEDGELRRRTAAVGVGVRAVTVVVVEEIAAVHDRRRPELWGPKP